MFPYPHANGYFMEVVNLIHNSSLGSKGMTVILLVFLLVTIMLVQLSSMQNPI